jgi:hypothetical protein
MKNKTILFCIICLFGLSTCISGDKELSVKKDDIKYSIFTNKFVDDIVDDLWVLNIETIDQKIKKLFKTDKEIAAILIYDNFFNIIIIKLNTLNQSISKITEIGNSYTQITDTLRKYKLVSIKKDIIYNSTEDKSTEKIGGLELFF